MLKIYFVALLVIVVDQLTKYWVVTHMTLRESIPVLEDVFQLTYLVNPGAAFGLLEHKRWLFVGLALVVVVGFLVLQRYIARQGMAVQLGAGLFVGGAIGNLIDRIRTGLVVDFFDFIIWPIFNVADIAICIGVVFIVWGMNKEEKLSKELFR